MGRDLVCFSHLRWDFVYQRPNHLMSRAARDRRVWVVEEPVDDDTGPRLDLKRREGLTVATPVLRPGTDATEAEAVLRKLIDDLFRDQRIHRPVLWYYTPMAFPWTRHLDGPVVYDSMDYLAGFRGAPAGLLELEDELLERADLVFSGGTSLQRRMSERHRQSHLFASSVDVGHFARARTPLADPEDQAAIAHPRLGYAGVVDERIDLGLVDGVAAARPDLELILVGPTAKIDPADLPVRENIHWLGLKAYADLPAYFAGWDAGWMPFARNEATEFISPTKTPEYLAAGLRVVSTSIHDVVEPYGREGFVTIADTVGETIAAIDRILLAPATDLARVDAFLAKGSWDRTWQSMTRLIDAIPDSLHLPARVRAAQRIERSTRPPRRAAATPLAVAAGRASERRSPGQPSRGAVGAD